MAKSFSVATFALKFGKEKRKSRECPTKAMILWKKGEGGGVTGEKLEIWPQRPRYFTATIAMHHAGGGGTFHGRVHGPNLLDGSGGGVASIGGG